eukprot:5282805-Pyramimonas_sp.AAC.1
MRSHAVIACTCAYFPVRLSKEICVGTKHAWLISDAAPFGNEAGGKSTTKPRDQNPIFAAPRCRQGCRQ